MKLPAEVLYKGIELAPDGPDHIEVWHLCSQAEHRLCAKDLGTLALVSEEAPDIPDTDTAGLFLMRLHPLRRHVQVTDGGSLGVRMAAATSFTYSTVWQADEPRQRPPLR